jgi:PLP dependent protein
MISSNLSKIKNQIFQAAAKSKRDPSLIKLVAVSKRKPVEDIEKAVKNGQILFGENYLQESLEKVAIFDKQIRWHFIGHLQTNKAKLAVNNFDLIETVDRLKLAIALNKESRKLEKITNILLQVNIGNEPQKSGVQPEKAADLLVEINQLSNLRVKGLMIIPPWDKDSEKVRPYFRQTKQLGMMLTEQNLLGKHGPVELSMGMSNDFEIAIQEGATIIRVGTALFGPRD